MRVTICLLFAACSTTTSSEPPPVIVTPLETPQPAVAPPPRAAIDASVAETPDARDASVALAPSVAPAKSSGCAGSYRLKQEVMQRCQCTNDLCMVDPTDAAALQAQLEIKLAGATSVTSKKNLPLDVLVKNKDAAKPIAFGLMQDRHVGWTVKDGNGVAAGTMGHDCDPQWTRQLDQKRTGPPRFTLVYLDPGETKRFITEVATDAYRPYPTSPPKPPACLVGLVLKQLFGGTERGSLLARGQRYTVEVSLPFADAGTRAATTATTGFEVK